MYIVGEYLFLENFIINYLILQGIRVVTRTKANKKRIVVTAGIAALYPFVLFVPSLYLLSRFYMKLIISIIIIKAAFNANSLGLYLKQLSAFYIISFVFAGASVGLYFFTNDYYGSVLKDSNFLYGFPIKYLLLGVLIGGLIFKNLLTYFQGMVARESELLEVMVFYQGKKILLTALVDTGNSLIEPISKLPVFIVEYPLVEELLAKEIRETFKKNTLDFHFLEKLMESNNEMDLKLIPFKSIGKKSGIILGFKPDYILISQDTETNIYEDLIIGIYQGRLSQDEQYRGLLNLEILKGGNICAKES